MTTIDPGDGRSTEGTEPTESTARTGEHADPGLDAEENAALVAWLRSWSPTQSGDVYRFARIADDAELRRIRVKYAAVGRSAGTRAALLSRALQDGRLRLQNV